jgi:hypothetical protein
LKLTIYRRNVLYRQHFLRGHMSTIPFEKQFLPSDPVEQLEQNLAHGMAVSGHELRRVIECSTDRQLDDQLRKIISRFSVAAAKSRGRPCTNRGAEDFALDEVDARYPALLGQYERDARQRRLSATAEGNLLPSAEQTPSELAYTELLTLKGVKAVFPNIGWQALRNKHSAWKSGRYHSADKPTASDDFDAEIERRFPAPTCS